jgi:hypothetical protein
MDTMSASNKKRECKISSCLAVVQPRKKLVRHITTAVAVTMIAITGVATDAFLVWAKSNKVVNA